MVAGKLRQQERLTPVPRRPEHEVDFFRESALAEIETDENIRCQEDGTGAIKHVPCPAYQFPGVERRKRYRRADEEYGLHLLAREDDLMRRAHAVDIGRAIRDSEIAGIHHTQVDMQSFPKLLDAGHPRLVPGLARFEGPVLPGIDRVDILQPIFLQPPHRWLKPGVEDRRTQFAKKIPHPVVPPKLLLVGARGHEIQGTRKIDA